jgi:hypothetical protein
VWVGAQVLVLPGGCCIEQRLGTTAATVAVMLAPVPSLVVGRGGWGPPPLAPPPPPEQHTYPMSLLNAFPLAPAPLLNPVPDTPSSL